MVVKARILDADDRRRTIVMHSQPLRDTDGAINGAVGNAYDITALREREAELSAFAGIVAHDLKDPLAAIAGFTALVQKELEPVGLPEVVALNGRVIKATTRMQRLIDALLKYAASRDGAMDTTEFELEAVVEGVVTERTSPTSTGRTPTAATPEPGSAWRSVIASSAATAAALGSRTIRAAGRASGSRYPRRVRM